MGDTSQRDRKDPEAESKPENPYGAPDAGGDIPGKEANRRSMEEIIEENDLRMQRSLDAPQTDTETSEERPPA